MISPSWQQTQTSALVERNLSGILLVAGTPSCHVNTHTPRPMVACRCAPPSLAEPMPCPLTVHPAKNGPFRVRMEGAGDMHMFISGSKEASTARRKTGGFGQWGRKGHSLD